MLIGLDAKGKYSDVPSAGDAMTDWGLLRGIWPPGDDGILGMIKDIGRAFLRLGVGSSILGCVFVGDRASSWVKTSFRFVMPRLVTSRLAFSSSSLSILAFITSR